MKQQVHNKRDIVNINIKGIMSSCIVLDVVKVSDLPVGESSQYALNKNWINWIYLKNVLCFSERISGSYLPYFSIDKNESYNISNWLIYKSSIAYRMIGGDQKFWLVYSFLETHKNNI